MCNFRDSRTYLAEKDRCRVVITYQEVKNLTILVIFMKFGHLCYKEISFTKRPDHEKTVAYTLCSDHNACFNSFGG